jgi:hypothetical protein
MRQPKAVGNRPDLHGTGFAVDGRARPDRPASSPTQHVRCHPASPRGRNAPRASILADSTSSHCDLPAGPRGGARASPCARRPSGRKSALAFAQHMVDRRCDRRQHCAVSPLGPAVKAVGILLGDEAGGQPPARQRGWPSRRQERHVVRMPSMTKASSASAMRIDGRRAVGRGCTAWRSSDRSGPGSRRPHRRRCRCAPCPRRARLQLAAGSAPAGRSTAGSCGTGPRHRCGSRPPSH